ncbi:MAG: translation elongation factor Ts [Clostridiales bacterium]|jgi:elongation factor Ts|nr:translation elongation factor Ts [Clostridiales bacterium]
MITAESVKELREKTGCGMMDCKRALTEAGGDAEKAIELLREKGLATAAKKSGRIASEGIVNVAVEGNIGVVVEVNAETDFVAKNDDFQKFVGDVTKQIITAAPTDVPALLEQAFVDDGSVTVGQMLTEKIAKIGENMNIRRFERIEGVTEGYIHGGGRIGVLVQFDTDAATAAKPAFKEFAKDMAMQVAAAFPQYVQIADVDSAVIEKEKEILAAQALNEGKPEAIIGKMVEGRIAKFYKEVCIVEQPFIKDPDKTVKALIKEKEAELGAAIQLVRFVRYEKGEGLEKKEENFADEVAGMMK